MDLELEGRRAVVTGGSRGIGLAAARALAAEGCDLVLVARGADMLAAAAATIASQSGRRVLAIPADTGADDSVARMAREATEQLGGIDILVNAAARPNRGSGITEADLEFELNVKLRGYLRCARAFAPGMAQRGWGRIVNVSGLAARNTGSIVGSVRNVAVAAMTKNLAEELGPQGINVTVVHPGMTVTEATAGRLEAIAQQRGTTPEEVAASMASQNTIGRLPTADEVASVIAFLASPRSVAINGDAIAAGGGQRGSIHY